MKFKLTRYTIEIVPENEQDEAYIVDTLGLSKGGDFVKLVRKNAIGMSCLALLETEKIENDEQAT